MKMIAALFLQRMIAKRRFGELKCMKDLQRCNPNIPVVFCRTCLNTKNLRPVFSKPDHKEMSDKLKLVTGLEIKYNDGLSQMICETCLKVIDIALQFRSKSKHAQDTLLSLVKTQKIKVKPNQIVRLIKKYPYFEIEMRENTQQHKNTINKAVTRYIKKEPLVFETRDNNLQSDKMLYSKKEVQSFSNCLLEYQKHPITFTKNHPEITIKRISVKIEKNISSGKEMESKKDLVKVKNVTQSTMKHKSTLNIVKKELGSGIKKLADRNKKSTIIRVSNLPPNWDKKDPYFRISKSHAMSNKKTLTFQSSVSQFVESDSWVEPHSRSDSKIQSDPGRHSSPKRQSDPALLSDPKRQNDLEIQSESKRKSHPGLQSDPKRQNDLGIQSEAKRQSDPKRQGDLEIKCEAKRQGESEIQIEILPEKNKKYGIIRVQNLPKNWDKKRPYYNYNIKINRKAPSQYEKHMIKITSNPDHLLYKCKICNKTYKHLISYRAHEQVHTNSSVCELCGKKCRNTATLMEHQRAIHGFKKIHKCSYCEASFARKEPLQVHERRHKNERPYICDYCGSGFMTRATLTQHIGTHLPPTVQCPLCPLKLKSHKLLINHKAQKHGKRYSYMCPICLKEFNNNKYTHKHLRRAHGLPSAQHPLIEKRLRT